MNSQPEVATLYVETTFGCYRIGGRRESDMYQAWPDGAHEAICLQCRGVFVSRNNRRVCTEAACVMATNRRYYAARRSSGRALWAA